MLLSPDPAFSFSPAEAPPEGLDSLEPSPLEDSPLPSLLGVSLEEPVPVVLVVLVAVVEVEVVCTAAFSALVSVGGVISGALLGTASETLLLPHAPRLTASSAAQAASAIRAVKAAPCAARRWDSR